MKELLSLLKIQTAYAQGYAPLVSLPGINAGTPSDLTSYLNAVFSVGIGIAAALAVLMIVIGGIQYMSTDAVGGKEEAKGRITSALWGLLLALCSVLILTTINPQLLNTSLQSFSGQNAPAVIPTASNNASLGAYGLVMNDYANQAAINEQIQTGVTPLGNGVSVNGNIPINSGSAVQVQSPLDQQVSLPLDGGGSLNGTLPATPNSILSQQNQTQTAIDTLNAIGSSPTGVTPGLIGVGGGGVPAVPPAFTGTGLGSPLTVTGANGGNVTISGNGITIGN